jgi:hypothetical protein
LIDLSLCPQAKVLPASYSPDAAPRTAEVFAVQYRIGNKLRSMTDIEAEAAAN